MGLEATEKRLNAKMATNVATGRNKVLRAVPLFLKKPDDEIRVLDERRQKYEQHTVQSGAGKAAGADEKQNSAHGLHAGKSGV